MEFHSTSTYFRRRSSYYEKRSSTISNKSRSILFRIPKPTPKTNNFTYRTEFYLQQRETQNIEKSSSSATITTTWRNLKYQKQTSDNDQAEIDRTLSTMDSIHKTFNRSLLIPHNKVYSSLYGDDNKSDRLMKTFCQCQNHYKNYELSMQDADDDDADDDDDDDDDDYDDDDDIKTEIISNSYENFQDTDYDDNMGDEEEKENENEKKNSYDSGYGSVMPMREYQREPLLKITQPWTINKKL